MWETTHEDKKILDLTILLLWCVVYRDVTNNRFSTKSPDCEHGKSRKISGDLRVNKIIFFYFKFRTKNMQGQ